MKSDQNRSLVFENWHGNGETHQQLRVFTEVVLDLAEVVGVLDLGHHLTRTKEAPSDESARIRAI